MPDSPQDHGTDYYEDDEPLDVVLSRYEQGRKVTSQPPGTAKINFAPGAHAQLTFEASSSTASGGTAVRLKPTAAPRRVVVSTSG